MPPNDSQGDEEEALSDCNSAVAACALIGVLPPPPSMYTTPARSAAPARPPKFHVAYAVTTDPPSEWPPSTTLPPSDLAASITVCRSSTATFIPHCFANATV